MNILVTASHVPFMSGGATHMVNGTVEALRQAGHQVELLRLPFHFAPESALHQLMDFTRTLDLSCPNGQQVDRVISLQFPGYGVQHPHHTVWLMHQHRAVYELFQPEQAPPALRQLREAVHGFDNQSLARANRRYAISKRVAQRLFEFNRLDAQPLLHPPPLAEHFRCETAQPYVFYPSRFESLKRQALLIEAAAHLRSNTAILLAGTGGQWAYCQQRIQELGVGHRVKLLGSVSEAEKIAFYSQALGVVFIPHDEDYGYITLEAMLSSKPVLTCTDSGGPLEFVLPGHTGRVVLPQPQAVAEAIDQWAQAPHAAREQGRAGRTHYHSLGLDWARTVEQLLSN